LLIYDKSSSTNSKKRRKKMANVRHLFPPFYSNSEKTGGTRGPGGPIDCNLWVDVKQVTTPGNRVMSINSKRRPTILDRVHCQN
ncbi:MAG: hypothetical protein O2780_14900, partial [Proteobacteria bacterium]|nr:hypothetical protein [Pseudomonadota bacterium]